MKKNLDLGYAKSQKRLNWREYQKKINRPVRQKEFAVKAFKICTLLFLIVFLIYSPGRIGCISHPNMANNKKDTPLQKSNKQTDLIPTDIKKVEQQKVEQQKVEQQSTLLTKKQIQSILDEKLFTNLNNKNFEYNLNNHKYHVETTIDPILQNSIKKNLMTSTSRYIGIVAIEPSTGKVLAMVSYDKINNSQNVCTGNLFPAASTFKIVTASAVVEKCGFNPDQILTFNGSKYTLYKTQLKEVNTKRSNKISFKEAFALSINPIFGKIGVNKLGKSTLEQYALNFGFNKPINFELPIAESKATFSEDDFPLAEEASGFNRRTIISPLYGAMLVSAFLNNGKIMEPTIIDTIKDENNAVIYMTKPSELTQAVKPDTAKVIIDLMEQTTTTGTCRRYYRGCKEDIILSKLDMGGKTGSINDGTAPVKYDWFIGFAQGKNGEGKIAVSIVVGHEKTIGLKASQYARFIFKEYFTNRT